MQNEVPIPKSMTAIINFEAIASGKSQTKSVKTYADVQTVL